MECSVSLVTFLVLRNKIKKYALYPILLPIWSCEMVDALGLLGTSRRCGVRTSPPYLLGFYLCSSFCIHLTAPAPLNSLSECSWSADSTRTRSIETYQQATWEFQRTNFNFFHQIQECTSGRKILTISLFKRAEWDICFRKNVIDCKGHSEQNKF